MRTRLKKLINSSAEYNLYLNQDLIMVRRQQLFCCLGLPFITIGEVGVLRFQMGDYSGSLKCLGHQEHRER
jgi:hypothetical protein